MVADVLSILLLIRNVIPFVRATDAAVNSDTETEGGCEHDISKISHLTWIGHLI